MTLKLKCYQNWCVKNWNVTKTEISSKLKCHHNWSVTKSEMLPQRRQPQFRQLRWRQRQPWGPWQKQPGYKCYKYLGICLEWPPISDSEPQWGQGRQPGGEGCHRLHPPGLLPHLPAPLPLLPCRMSAIIQTHYYRPSGAGDVLQTTSSMNKLDGLAPLIVDTFRCNFTNRENPHTAK